MGGRGRAELTLRWLRRLAVSLVPALACVAATPGHASTTVPGGTLLENTTWTLAGSPYLVQGTVRVWGPVTLTVEPGVAIRFASGLTLEVDGTLVAEGTASQPITFTSDAATPQRGDWGGVAVSGLGSARLAFCEISYAGLANAAAVLFSTSSCSLRDSGIHDNAGEGVRLTGAGLRPTLERVRLERNGGAAVYQDQLGMSAVYRELVMTENGINGVALAATWALQDAALDGSAMGVPFVALGEIGPYSGATLTVTPGTTVRFRPGNGVLSVDGTLRAEGTAAQPITFTSEAAAPQRGDWGGIWNSGRGTAHLAFCDISYAGRSGASAVQFSTSGCTLGDSRIHDNLGDGVRLTGDGLHPALERVRLESNGGAAISQEQLGMSPIYREVVMSGNGVDGVAIGRAWTNQDGTLDGSAMSGAFVALDELGVRSGTTLTVTPGTTVRFRRGTGVLTVDGTLMAEGTAAKRITFTSEAASPQRGDWGGVANTGRGVTRLANCDVAYAGANSAPAVVFATSGCSLADSRVHDNLGDGVRLIGDGLHPTIERVLLEGNGGAAVHQDRPGMNPVYRSLAASGNAPDAILVEGGQLGVSVGWDTVTAGIPIQVRGSVRIPAGQFLSLAPGAVVRSAADGRLEVSGSLFALGSAAQPVLLAGVTESPGAWSGVSVEAGGSAILGHCELAHGGQYGYPLLALAGSATIHNTRVHHSAADGIRVTGVRPILAGIEIYGNAFGLRNTTPGTVVDARRTWWGDASGPNHASNPAGLGNAVSDGVLFDPWLTEPGEVAPPANGVIVTLGGPARVSPGQTAEYSAFYLNEQTEPVNDAVLTIVLPATARYLDSTGGGIYWPELRQVFWRLGELAPGASGTVAARVVFRWGLPDRIGDVAMARLGGSSLPAGGLDVAPYLAYEPVVVSDESALSEAELAAERQAYPTLDTFLSEASSAGFARISASRLTLGDGRAVTRASLARRGAAMIVERDGDSVIARTLTATGWEVRDSRGGMSYDDATGLSTYSGSWDSPPGLATSSRRMEGLTLGTCFRNLAISMGMFNLSQEEKDFVLPRLESEVCLICMAHDLPRACLQCGTRAFSGTSNEARYQDNLSTILKKCSESPDRGACLGAKYTICENDPGLDLFVPGAPTSGERTYYCSGGVVFRGDFKLCKSGQPCEATATSSIGGSCESSSCGAAPAAAPPASAQAVVSPGYAGSWQRSCAGLASPFGTCSSVDTTVQIAHDPNEKAGPSGDILPGQSLDYTVSYENEGQGSAFGVYILDRLSSDLDESTLSLRGSATYIAPTREILWEIGELAAKGEAGSKGEVGFSVKARTGLASGTVITNQAVVYFPSVPEETPTNTVVNIIQPLAATPQSVTTTYMQPVAITLAGTEASGLPLTYSIADPPGGGALSGEAPLLTYTPAESFTGLDTFTFTVANGISTSRPAAVEITVAPSSADTTPPAVVWTYPENGATLSAVVVKPVLVAAGGPTYAPSLLVQLSEAIDPETLDASSVTVRSTSGLTVAVSLGFDAASNQLRITLRERWQPTRYTVTLGTGVKDAAGNSLAAPYVWSFTASPPGVVRPRLHSSP